MIMPDSAVSQIFVSVLEVPFEKPITSALGTYIGSDYVVVELQTTDGIVGYGYTMSLDRRGTKAVVSYIENELTPLALRQDVKRPTALWQRMWSPNKARMRGGVGVHALSAVDTAVWDAAAKTAGLPLGIMLGGSRKKVPAYGSGGWLSMEDNELIEEAQNHAEKGISAYKLKIGGKRDKARLKLLRREMGDAFTLYVDANQNFNVADAVKASEWLSDFDVAWLEEPVLADCPWELEEVAAATDIPIAAGENVYFAWGFRDLCDRQAASYLQPDIGRCGGVTEWIKIAKMAETHNLKLTSHLLHEVSTCLVGAFSSGFAVEHMNFFTKNPFTNDFTVKNGFITLPDVSGHGVEFCKLARKIFTI